MIPALEDVCMAHRWLYYGKSEPVISDYEYDQLEYEAMKSCGPSSPLLLPGGAFANSTEGFTPLQIMLAKEMASGKRNGRGVLIS